MNLKAYAKSAIDAIEAWQHRWGAFHPHPALDVPEERLAAAFETYVGRLQDNYPFFHPRYAGQMLKPPHPAAVIGYLAAQLINPNNHALDGGPPTGQMEKEVVQALAAMFHLPEDALGHLTSGGTIANLEALWVARELHPGKAVAFTEAAHYTHSRMSQVLKLGTTVVPGDAAGRMDLDALEKILQTGRVGSVVVTAGTTGLGLVDPIAGVVALCRRYGCRVHVDAAYGGFFSLLAWDAASPLDAHTRAQFQAIGRCDSVAIDPHKHGLQPYGCGCVVFRDPAVGRFYRHDSPYTYFTSEELHLGEISLECSRAGAAAGALWFTLQLLPLAAGEGLGPILAACLRAAKRWHQLLEASDVLTAASVPELDIVTFYPRPSGMAVTSSRVDAASQQLFTAAMEAEEDPVFLSLYRMDATRIRQRRPQLQADQPQARVLRSVLMKPEHESYVGFLHERLSRLAHERLQ